MDLSCLLGIALSVPTKAKFFGVMFWPYNKSFIAQACFRSRWLDIGLVPFFAFLWTSTLSQSLKTQKKNLANIQPLSITHISCLLILTLLLVEKVHLLHAKWHHYSPLDGRLVHCPPPAFMSGFLNSLPVPIYTPGWREALFSNRSIHVHCNLLFSIQTPHPFSIKHPNI